ncbi:hypothetical protein ACIU1J_10125 [Azospirillum doebereinerae]|uniref:hypothetical protein n=1 Tax=Azospirillum doebereinerae TaxID=92933 RepID=UPI001EE5B6E7|nr:hypothetical protein [Azospirillum doebereinerae]MCG5244146.1 hypothetical protein [Azospirillum doebereinerae]
MIEPARRLATGFYDIWGRESPASVFEEGARIDADGAMSEAEFRTLHGFLDAVETDWR